MGRRKIKAILFDMVGVLIFRKKDYKPSTLNEINAENIERLFNHLDDEKLLRGIRYKLRLSKVEIDRAVQLIPDKYERLDELWEKLPEIKNRYKIAVINNGNSSSLKYWKQKFNFNVFDLFINSTEVGVKKPDPKIFLLACKKLKVNPKECLFMDDSVENVNSAKGLGMQSIWWNREKGTKVLLNEFFKEVKIR